MRFAHTATLTHRIPGAILLACGALLLCPSSKAADAHRGVQAAPGEIVMLRNVAARPAYRSAPPGMALIVNPSPRPELSHALGTDELSEADYAELDATSATGQAARGTTVEQMIGRTLGSSVGGASARGGAAGGNGFGQIIAGPTGSLGGTAGGIGHQVQGALSQLPGMLPASSGGH